MESEDPLRILGIDPGSNVTGYGVVDWLGGRRLVHVASGSLRPPRTASLSARLDVIYRAIGEVIGQHRPDTAVVEQVFVASNPRAALVLGQARGVALAAAAAAELGVTEYAATRIKRAVTGSGRAGKPQVQHMVRRLLNLESMPDQDAADALAAAICHAHAGRLGNIRIGSRNARRVVARPRSRL